MSGTAGRATRLIPMALLAACNTAPVLPPADERTFELPRTSLWSGGELAVVVRYAEGEQPPPAVTLDGTALVVTRVDDTTFSAALPVHTGELPVEVVAEGVPTLASAVTLHGFVAAQLGPGVGGSVLPLPGSGGLVVLGATREGVASVSLETGQVVATWPKTVHAIECANGIVPGPAPNQVVLRAGAEGSYPCAPNYSLFGLTSTGVGAKLGEAMPGWGRSVAAVVGPLTAVLGFHDNWGQYIRCNSGSPWESCQPLPPLNAFQAGLRGFEAGYAAGRILGLGIRIGMHDLATGDIVAMLPHHEAGGLVTYRAAAFSSTQDSLYITALRNDTTIVLVLDSQDGSELGRAELAGGWPIGVAVDGEGGRILVAQHDRAERRYWLTVVDAASLDVIATLPASTGPVADAIRDFEHGRLVVLSSGDRTILVATNYTPWFDSAPIPPMAIAQWSLAD